MRLLRICVLVCYMLLEWCFVDTFVLFLCIVIDFFFVCPAFYHIIQSLLEWCFFDCADDTQMSDIPTVSNVRQDLTEWQEKHANLVLSTVKVAPLLELKKRKLQEVLNKN